MVVWSFWQPPYHTCFPLFYMFVCCWANKLPFALPLSIAHGKHWVSVVYSAENRSRSQVIHHIWNDTMLQLPAAAEMENMSYGDKNVANDNYNIGRGIKRWWPSSVCLSVCPVPEPKSGMSGHSKQATSIITAAISETAVKQQQVRSILAQARSSAH